MHEKWFLYEYRHQVTHAGIILIKLTIAAEKHVLTMPA